MHNADESNRSLQAFPPNRFCFSVSSLPFPFVPPSFSFSVAGGGFKRFDSSFFAFYLSSPIL
jgi:hypothetical protein